MRQTHFFTTEQCETENHQSCSENYEGMGIIAKCVCHCHNKDNLASDKARQAPQTPLGRQTNLEEFGDSIV